MTRAIIAIFGLSLLAGCAAEKPASELPAMYVNMAEPGAHLDSGGRLDDLAIPAEQRYWRSW